MSQKQAAPLRGETIVFTGALLVSRHCATEQARRMGAKVADRVTDETTILVVGQQRVVTRSAKQRKAEALLDEWHHITVMNGADFHRLVGRWHLETAASALDAHTVQ